MEISPRLIFAIVFFSLLTWYFLKNKHNMKTSGWFPLLYFSMYRTSWGIKLMDRLAKKARRPILWFGTAGVVIGFIVMVWICYELIKNFIGLITKETELAGAGLVLPVDTPFSFYVPFEYWIISIIIIAAIHEYAHGVLMRAHKIKVKSSGLAFLGILLPIIPAAFVEPDEKDLRKRPLKEQLHVYAAGPFINILAGLALIPVMLLMASFVSPLFFTPDGVTITGFVAEGLPAQNAGIELGEVVKQIDGQEITSVASLAGALQDKQPGESIQLTTDASTYDITLAESPSDSTRPYLGTYLAPSSKTSEGFGPLPDIYLWFVELIKFLFILNIGIGAFNLVPIGPLDGGRMVHAVATRYLKKEQAMQLLSLLSLIFLLIVLMIVFFPILPFTN